VKLRGWVGSMLLMLMHAPEVGAREPADAAITRAVFVEGRLWVLADSTSLSALEPKTKTHVKVPGNLCVSFALPDVALVLSNVNQRDSLSGAVPLIAPR
jgi:hypothetical protein